MHPIHPVAPPSVLHALFDPVGIVILLGLGVAGFLLGLIVAAIRNDRGAAITCAIETGVLALVGGLLARCTVALFVALLGNRAGAVDIVSWGFFLWAGPVDLIGHVATGKWLMTLPVLLFLCGVLGALTGLFNGLWRIHDWSGTGWIAFPLDVTWGLSGNLNGLLIHLVNQVWADSHPYEPRDDVHRYVGGFGLQKGFRFTQGCVISNTEPGDTPGSTLFRHERTHAWQNRAFGPFFPLTYLCWMAILLVPAVIAGLATRDMKNALQVWCYFNNPWEVWAYSATGDDRHWGDKSNKLLWPPAAVIAAAIPFVAVFSYGCFLVLRK